MLKKNYSFFTFFLSDYQIYTTFDKVKILNEKINEIINKVKDDKEDFKIRQDRKKV